MAWLVSLPLWGDVKAWQVAIHTVASVLTLLLVALLENAGRRSAEAAQEKLNVIAEALAALMASRALEDNTLDEAVTLLRQPKPSRRRQASARTVLAELGAHPEGGAPVKLLAGRYGPYVTDGQTNASLPKDTKPDTLTLDEAVALLKARAESGSGARRGGARGGSARRTAGATGRRKVARKAR